jgi:hypothetical protein
MKDLSNLDVGINLRMKTLVGNAMPLNILLRQRCKEMNKTDGRAEFPCGTKE